MSETDLLARVHERLDDLVGVVAKLAQEVAVTNERCGPCQDSLKGFKQVLHGNGGNGLLARVVGIEERTKEGADRLSIKGLVILLGAMGTLTAAIAAAIGAAVASTVK